MALSHLFRWRPKSDNSSLCALRAFPSSTETHQLDFHTFSGGKPIRHFPGKCSSHTVAQSFEAYCQPSLIKPKVETNRQTQKQTMYERGRRTTDNRLKPSMDASSWSRDKTDRRTFAETPASLPDSLATHAAATKRAAKAELAAGCPPNLCCARSTSHSHKLFKNACKPLLQQPLPGSILTSGDSPKCRSPHEAGF
ncbi:hypothetical protein GGQ71_001846 [Rhizobium taibaishanense]|uniref:Uncharacterized protein n=1 Tax=Allorhizobium taibaishanense TaxID=887144 RepID=A0A7W6HLU3_9HYPH|nr:hypothetical protein [Allorhizobium taibaishanense]